jgi:hypothetical protein
LNSSSLSWIGTGDLHGEPRRFAGNRRKAGARSCVATIIERIGELANLSLFEDNSTEMELRLKAQERATAVRWSASVQCRGEWN